MEVLNDRLFFHVYFIFNNERKFFAISYVVVSISLEYTSKCNRGILTLFTERSSGASGHLPPVNAEYRKIYILAAI